MVQGNSEAVCNDIVFVVEGTAACGAYLNEIKSNYILPTIEYFNGGTIQEDKDCGSETFATLYTLVVYHAADRMPAFLVDVYGPFRNPHKFLQLFDKLDFSGGHAENMAALTEGMATALHCFKDLAVLRDPGLLAQKYCILICNSPPYSIGVMDVPGYQGQTLEQLATQMTENNIQLSIISPRRLPTWINLFDKAGGDSATANTKHYAKDLRHLVMLSGFSLQESVVNQPPVATVAIPPVPTSPHGTSPSQQPTIRPPAVAPAAVRPPQPQQNQQQGQQRPVVPFGMNMGNPTSSQNVTITNNVPPMMTQGDSGPRIRGPNPRWPAPNQGQPIQVQNQMQQQQPQQQQQQQQQPQTMMGMNNMGSGQIAGQMRQPNQVQLQPPIQNPLQPQQVLQNQQQQQPQQTNVQGVQVMNQNPIQNVVLQQQPQQPMGANTMQPHVQLQQGMPQGQTPGQMMVNPQQQGIRPFGQQGVNQGVNVNQGQASQIVNQQQIMNQQQQAARAAVVAQQQQQQQQQAQLQQAQQQQQHPNPNVNIGMANQQQSLQQQIPTAVVAPVSQQVQQPQPGQQQPGATAAPANPARERQYIWQGMLEWQEKTRDPQKMARHVPCQVSAAVVNGDTEVKADHWPQKLLMQLIPKSLISNFGGAHFRNARSVMFHPQECEALEALAKVMSTGYAGCVHFTGMVNPLACEIKVLMLLYSPDKKAYIGFIPNDQAGFVDRIRKVIQQQKNKQGQPPGQPPGPGQPGPAPNQIAQQQPSANILVTQTNPLAMGGGQLSATSQPQQQPQMIQQAQQPTPMAGPTMAGPPVRGVAQTPAQLEAERQQNLMTIKKLQETLEAAQQKEVQLKAMEQQQRRVQMQQQQQMQMQHQIQPQQQQMQQAQQQQIQNMQQPGVSQAGMMGGQVNMNSGPMNIQQQQMNQQQLQLQQQQQQMAQQMQQRNIRPAAMQNNPGNNPGLRNLLQQQQYRPQMMQQPNTQNRMQQPNVNMQQQQQQQQQGGSQFDNLSLADLLQ